MTASTAGGTIAPAEKAMTDHIRAWMVRAGAVGMAEEFAGVEGDLGNLASVIRHWGQPPHVFVIGNAKGHAGLNEYFAGAHEAVEEAAAKQAKDFRAGLTESLPDCDHDAFARAESVLAQWMAAALWIDVLPGLMARVQDETGDSRDLALWRDRGACAARLILADRDN